MSVCDYSAEPEMRWAEGEGEIMFFEPAFWVIIAGAVIGAYGFLGLAFSRLGNELPASNADKSPKEQPGVRRAGWTAPHGAVEDEESEAQLPNPLSTDADRSEKTKPKR